MDHRFLHLVILVIFVKSEFTECREISIDDDTLQELQDRVFEIKNMLNTMGEKLTDVENKIMDLLGPPAVPEQQQGADCGRILVSDYSSSDAYILSSDGERLAVETLRDKVFAAVSGRDGSIFLSVGTRDIYNYETGLGSQKLAGHNVMGPVWSSNASGVTSLAADPLNRLLFAALSGSKVFSLNYDGTSEQVLASEDVGRIHHMVVDVNHQDLYICNQPFSELVARIERISYNETTGFHRQVLANVSQPAGMALDDSPGARRMFVLTETGMIWSLELDEPYSVTLSVSAPSARTRASGLLYCAQLGLLYIDQESDTVWQTIADTEDGDNRREFNLQHVGSMPTVMIWV